MRYVYSSAAYATAFNHLANVAKIESLGIWVTTRPIPGSSFQDAIGLYPMCWPTNPFSKMQLCQELMDLGLVSLVLVTDPFMTATDWFGEIFDHVRPYKTHYTIENSAETTVFSKHHRYYIRKSAERCETRTIRLSKYLKEWQSLYENLIEKHNLTEFHQFPPQYFQSLAAMPQFTAFGAFIDGELVSASLWVEHDGLVASHLIATSDLGYSHNSGYAVYDHAIRHYAGSYDINLGGSPDTKRSGSKLDFVKKGFSDATRENWICGVIAEPGCYAKLTQDASVDADVSQYFPAYRQPK